MDTLTLFYHDFRGCTAVFYTIPILAICPACKVKTTSADWISFEVLTKGAPG